MSNERYYVPCTVTGNALAEAKNEKKTPSVKIALRTIPQKEGEQARVLYADLWLSDAAFEGSLKTLEEVLGWTGITLAELNEPVLAGVEVVAVCEQEYNEQLNKWFEKVVFINRPGGGGVAKLDDAQSRQVVGKLDALLSRHRQNKPGASRAATPVTRRPAAAPAAQRGAPTANAAPADDSFFGNEPPQRQRQSGDPADYGIAHDKGAF